MGGAGFRAFMLDLHQLNERPSLSYQVCQDLGGEIQVDISITNGSKDMTFQFTICLL